MWWVDELATHRQGPSWAQALGYGVAAAALVARRVQPLQCLLVVCGVLALQFIVIGSPEGLGRHARAAGGDVHRGQPRGTPSRAGGPGSGVGPRRGLDSLRPAQRGPRSSHAQATVWLSPWVIAWLLGAYLRTRRLYAQGLVREREEQCPHRRRRGAQPDRPGVARRRRAQRQRDDCAGVRCPPADAARPGEGTRGPGDGRGRRSRGAGRDASDGRRPPVRRCPAGPRPAADAGSARPPGRTTTAGRGWTCSARGGRRTRRACRPGWT